MCFIIIVKYMYIHVFMQLKPQCHTDSYEIKILPYNL